MNASSKIAASSVAELTQMYETGEITPVDVVQAFAERILRHNPRINAFLHLRIEEALKEAALSIARWRAGNPLSPIDGITCGVKSNIAVANMPWHAGIAAYRANVATRDADCITNLKNAGAIILGMLNMHEGALGATTNNLHFGRCNNPWGEGLTPGGSSGGSGASIAAGMCNFSLGTDTMGSVRIPSAYCGIVGHKPTYGLVPSDGLIDLSPTLDHIGPHARYADDIERILPVLSQMPMSLTKTKLDVPSIGIAYWADNLTVDKKVSDAFTGFRAVLEQVGTVRSADISGYDFSALRRKGLLISEVEGYRFHERMLKIDPDGFSDDFTSLLSWGNNQSANKQRIAFDRVKDAGDQFNDLISRYDAIITPTVPQGPFAFSDEVPANQADFTCIANFSGAPAISVPVSTDGMPPLSIQIIAAKGNDDVCISLATKLESLRGTPALPPGYFSP